MKWNLPDNIKPFIPERGLTRNEYEALSVLYNRCLHDEELRNAMSSIRGGLPEWIMKHYIRKYESLKLG